MNHKINNANIKEWAKNYDGELFDGILCDPPYELGFMGKSWDSSGIAFDQEMWADIFKLLKPGGHLLAFSGSRTYHRMAVAIEDAGFEIRDMIEYIYGSGFPKSTNIYKQLKKQCTCGNMEVYENRVQQVGSSREQEAEYYLRFMLERDVQTTKPISKERGQVLQSSVSEQSTHDERQTSVAGLSVPERREEPSLEERDNLQATKGQLQGRDISEVSREVSTNGEERRLHNATQVSDGSTSGHNADEDSSSSSHRPQPEQQQYREPCTFCEQWGTQATRSYGTGSALKPSHEPICFARKPLDGTLASNYLKHGTGGLNIDGTRVGTTENLNGGAYSGGQRSEGDWKDSSGFKNDKLDTYEQPQGRFPANLIHDASDEVAAVFPQTKGDSPNRKPRVSGKPISTISLGENYLSPHTTRADSGSASRFFMTCKDTQKHAIMNVWNDINVNSVASNSTITLLTEKIVNISSALRLVPLNIDLVNRSLNAFFVGEKSKSTEIDFVAKLVAIKEVPEDTLSQQELKAIQDFMQNSGNSTQSQSHVSDVENKDSIDITKITVNLLKLCGYVLRVIDESTKQVNRENASDQATETRFLYTAKASKSERNAGLEGFEDKRAGAMEFRNRESEKGQFDGEPQYAKNHHPTVKPLSLTKYLATLIKPPTGGRLLVPFSGSGSEMIGALQAGWEYVEGVELTEEYIPIAEARIKYWLELKAKENPQLELI